MREERSLHLSLYINLSVRNWMLIRERCLYSGLWGSHEKVEAPAMERDSPFTTDETREQSNTFILLSPAIDHTFIRFSSLASHERLQSSKLDSSYTESTTPAPFASCPSLPIICKTLSSSCAIILTTKITITNACSHSSRSFGRSFSSIQ